MNPKISRFQGCKAARLQSVCNLACRQGLTFRVMLCQLTENGLFKHAQIIPLMIYVLANIEVMPVGKLTVIFFMGTRVMM